MHACRRSLGDALGLSLQHHPPFKLSNRPDHIQHQLAGGSRGIDAHAQNLERRSGFRDAFDDLAHMDDGAGQTVELADDELVALAGRVQRRLKARPSFRRRVVNQLAVNLDPPPSCRRRCPQPMTKQPASASDGNADAIGGDC